MSLGKHVDVNNIIKEATHESIKHKRKPHIHDLAYSSRYVNAEVPKYEMPEKSMSSSAAYQIVHDEMVFDGDSTKNMATFVTSWMEPEADKLLSETMGKNFADMDEYPRTIEIQNRCVNMLARLWNAHKDDQPIGTYTTGSSEAFMLGGLALKFNWRKSLSKEKQQTARPNIVFGHNAQVCVEKFAVYFDVEARKVPVSKESHFALDIKEAVKLCDENTIAVVVILGSTYTGYFENVQGMSQALDELEREKGWNIPIHVDAASGGFFAPFLFPELVWDFRLPRVKSINASGHKYGLVYPGIGWAVWRDKKCLPEELVFHLDYLGGDEPTFTLNFSRSSSPVIGQYYNFLRLGKEGYREVVGNCLENAQFLSHCLLDSGYFEMLSEVHKNGVCSLPVVSFSLKKQGNKDNTIQGKVTSLLNEYDIAEELKKKGWTVPAYKLPPKCEEISLLRVVVRECHSKELLEALVADIVQAVETIQKNRLSLIDKLSLKEEQSTSAPVETSKKKDTGANTGKSEPSVSGIASTTYNRVC